MPAQHTGGIDAQKMLAAAAGLAVLFTGSLALNANANTLPEVGPAVHPFRMLPAGADLIAAPAAIDIMDRVTMVLRAPAVLWAQGLCRTSLPLYGWRRW